MPLRRSPPGRQRCPPRLRGLTPATSTWVVAGSTSSRNPCLPAWLAAGFSPKLVMITEAEAR